MGKKKVGNSFMKLGQARNDMPVTNVNEFETKYNHMKLQNKLPNELKFVGNKRHQQKSTTTFIKMSSEEKLFDTWLELLDNHEDSHNIQRTKLRKSNSTDPTHRKRLTHSKRNK